MKHVVSLSGSYAGGDVDKLFSSLAGSGVIQMNLVGREISLQVRGENLEEVKSSLKKLGVNNINLLELRKSGITFSGSGAGNDNDKKVHVSVIPSTLDGGLRLLAFLYECEITEEIAEKLSSGIEEILRDAGVTDALYTVHIKDNMCSEELVNSVKTATLNAIFDAGGIVNIE